MKTSKEHLLADKDLSAWWAGVSRDPRFERLILICGADIVQMQQPEKINGATSILETLITMADNPPPEYKPATSGMQFDLNPKK